MAFKKIPLTIDICILIIHLRKFDFNGVIILPVCWCLWYWQCALVDVPVMNCANMSLCCEVSTLF